MGSLSLLKEQTLMQDLKVTILSSTKLHPLEKQERRSMFLSNIDQVLNFDVHTVHFFKKNTKFSIENVVEKLKLALEKLLVPYDLLAGRLNFNNTEGRLEIDCNAKGVRLIVASSELSLEDLGELDYPNPAFKQLAAEQAFGDHVDEHFDRPLCVTSFKCGGFAMGVCNNHCTFDGISFQTFLINLAAVAAGEPLAVPPCNDRRLLAARSPPIVKFPHPELIKLQPSSSSSSMIVTCTNNNLKLNHKLFHLTSIDISTLKQKAQGCKHTISSFNVVAAHLWRCKALASKTSAKPTDEASMLFAVNLRPRLKPPLPQSYTGNAVLSAWCSTTYKELMKEGSFKEVVEVVCEGGRRMDDEYARSVIDWGELYKGFPKGDVFVSSWWKLGFEEVVYPWGKPVYSCPVVVPSQDITVVFPAFGGVDKGVNVLVALPCELMDHYSTLFYEFLQS
ncbi:putative omega-hydroxypalmitate O-feruloyl transferase [Dioscorea sansibarensis]